MSTRQDQGSQSTQSLFYNCKIHNSVYLQNLLRNLNEVFPWRIINGGYITLGTFKYFKTKDFIKEICEVTIRSFIRDGIFRHLAT